MIFRHRCPVLNSSRLLAR